MVQTHSELASFTRVGAASPARAAPSRAPRTGPAAGPGSRALGGRPQRPRRSTAARRRPARRAQRTRVQNAIAAAPGNARGDQRVLAREAERPVARARDGQRAYAGVDVTAEKFLIAMVSCCLVLSLILLLLPLGTCVSLSAAWALMLVAFWGASTVPSVTTGGRMWRL